MSKPSYYLGIDLSKRTFHYRLDDQAGNKIEAGVWANDAPSIVDFITKLLKFTPAGSLHACMEATGRCGYALWNALHNTGIAVSIVNPAQMKAYAASLNKRGKNDTMDASTIARYVRERTPYTMEPPSDGLSRLREIIGEVDHLVAERARVKTRLGEIKPSECRPVIASLKRQIKAIDKEIAMMEKAVEKLLVDHPQIAADIALLQSIPGIARRTALRVLAQIGGKQFASARQMAAYAGVTPSDHSSGTSLRKPSRMSKKGNAVLRKALYMPAMSFRRSSDHISDWANGVAQRTGSKMAALGAVMRKLMHVIFGVLKHRQPFKFERIENPAY